MAKVDELVQYKVHLRRIGDAKDQEVHRFYFHTHDDEMTLDLLTREITKRSPYFKVRPNLKFNILWLDAENDHIMLPDSSALLVAAEDCINRNVICKLMVYVPREAATERILA